MGHAGRWVAGGRRCINTKLDDLSPEEERERDGEGEEKGREKGRGEKESGEKESTVTMRSLS